jgi:GH15 family glucan-1,4-alpha-glucosidase
MPTLLRRSPLIRAPPRHNQVLGITEEVDSGSGEPLGIFPQAFSHIGLVKAAWAIARAESSGTTIS